MKLVVVESPTKCRTLGRFLGKEYQLESTMGHIRDLPKTKLGVETKGGFRPTWRIVPGKKKVIENLKKGAKKAKKILLATDPDREGEAIAWHVAQILVRQGNTSEVKSTDISEVKELARIVFHEITKRAIERALKDPRSIDMDLVEAQKARRILDRLVGYKLSPLLWKKVRRGLSAGRVQSVAVRLIVEREREIEKFLREEYWQIFAALAIPDRPLGPIGDRDGVFVAELIAKSGKKYLSYETVVLFSGKHTFRKTTIKNEKEAEGIILDLSRPFIVEDLKKKALSYHPLPPFTTSTLQQTAGRKFGFTSQMTMNLAQNLYERGLISYQRTDSTKLAASAVASLRRYIKKNYGDRYLPKTTRVYKTRSKVAQEAHEAIRPTKIERREIRLDRQARKLYELIWQRTVACQMASARLERSILYISCGDYQFETRGQRLLFDGFLKIYPIKFGENILPAVKTGDQLNLVSLGAIQSFTNPPPRYTEATLVRDLEGEGIGRPSTYAPIISVIRERQYVEKEEGRFKPTKLGEAVNDFLVDNFTDIVDIPFTAQMEDELDRIARGERKWVAAIGDFYRPFEKKLSSVQEKAERVKIETPKTGEKCPDCGGDLVIRIGKFGKFIACSQFPECEYTRPYLKKVKGVKCPKCGGGVIIKKTKRGKRFYGCSNWPKCDWASWRKPR